MPRLVLTACITLALVWAIGCGDSSPRKNASTVPVKGTVKLDGKPMPDGEITFVAPNEPVNQMPVKDGAFSGQAVPGKNTVQFAVYKDGPPLSTDPEKKPTQVNTLPPQYTHQSTIEADVKAEGANEFTFDVKSR